MSSCLVVQHVAPERPFAIGAALRDAGVDLDVRRTYADEALPRHLGDDVDGVVVMGGPMSAASDDGFASRRREIELLAEALEIGLPTLGVCLGAQLLASAAGGRVVPGNAGPEIGWAQIRLTPAASADPLFASVPESLTVLHWHGETYELPGGAVRLASSERYPEQAFRVGDRAWGLQFHLEVDESAVVDFVDAFADDLVAADTTAAAITGATPTALRALGPVRDAVLTRFAGLVAGGRASTGMGSVDQLADHL